MDADARQANHGTVTAAKEPLHRSRRGAALGLLAAALFGASAPVSKLLLPQAAPLLLASLLYLGAGIGLSVARIAGASSGEAKVRRADLPLLAGVIVAGGVLGPTLMLFGLRRLSGVAGSLLLNLEMPFTVLLAVMLFREHLGRREVLAALLIVAGAAMLRVSPGELRADAIGIAAIAGACSCWALDNNLAQRLTLRDPIAVSQIKTLGAGVCSLALALATGALLPPPGVVVAALVLGRLSYGRSIGLDMQARRLLGAAREAAYFATAPFAGALLSIPLLGESLGAAAAVAAALMIGGVALLLRERHGHVHRHEAMAHDHVHVHDEHHRHHDGPVDEPHSHSHEHEVLEHEHPHVSDLHHRHTHD